VIIAAAMGAHICTAAMWEGRSIGSSYVCGASCSFGSPACVQLLCHSYLFFCNAMIVHIGCSIGSPQVYNSCAGYEEAGHEGAVMCLGKQRIAPTFSPD